ncbi:MAG: radical SAM/Cys-rich domain protein [Deltaproteobacteria bacterium]|nr:radical SAM/Cys-rich domain protein [Deltaproteobacteria bacterium]
MLNFARKLENLGYDALHAEAVDTLQVNLGWRCNQSCKHCHFQAGPDRTEEMDRDTVEAVIAAVQRSRIGTVDLTGGAPEFNPHFPHLVESLAGLGLRLIDRCNLTILLEPGLEGLPQFLARHRVELVCSLPYFQEDLVDRLRGPGVFQKSLEALRRLNEAGYGREGSELILNLMVNPAGAYFPGPQEELEPRFRQELERRHGIRFHRLLTLINMPIGRFRDFLVRSGNYQRYLDRLAGSFNPATVPGLMCRHLLSVAWDGRLFDCDFNQALDLPLLPGLPQTIREFDLEALSRRPIHLGDHCYGCTAGCGSSCGGSLAEG